MSSAFVNEPIAGGFFYSTVNPTVSIFKLAEEGKFSLLANVLDGNPSKIHEKDAEIGMQVLHHACANGRYECVIMLLERGSSVIEKDSMGRTPLFFTWPFPDCARLLLQAGSDVNTLDNYGYTALHNCCYHGNFDVAKIIIEDYNQRITDMSAVNPRNGDTILHSVCRNGHIRIVILLVRAGAEIGVRNKDSKLPFECFKDEILRQKCAILSGTEIISIDVIRNNNYKIWFWLIQESEFDAHIKVTQYVNLYPELVHAKDTNGRSAIEMASKLNRISIQALLLWFGRYRVVESRPEHISSTCFLYKALDEMDLDSMNNPKQVAIKLVRRRSHFQRELEARKTGFSPDFVVDVVNTYPKEIGDVTPTSDDVTIDVHIPISEGGVVEMLKHQAELFYTLVMPLADRNMYVAMKQERFAGRDMEAVRHVFSQITRCVQHMHDNGFVHGDIKPLNIVRDGSQWKLIDLDASCAISKDTVCSKYSSAYIPPEAVYLSRITNRAVVRNESSLADKTTNTFPEKFLLLAHASFDVWSLGVVLYQLCTPDVRPLFQCDQDDNLVTVERSRESGGEEDCLWTLGEWSDKVKDRKLSKIPDLLARNLLAQMLSKDVHRRPHTSRILSHPFLSGKKVVRLVDQKPEYDVFLSYRVASDALHVGRLYEDLVSRGHKVWWDRACLKPGVPWKEGFCAGLASSRTFVCLLSRNAINHPTVDWQNFSKLSVTSKCDNVFLEYRLALELRELGYVERILPVLIGDVDESTGLYGPFFRGGCLPVAQEIVVDAVEKDLLYYMDSLALGTCVSGQPTVAATLGSITACQGVQIEGDGDKAFRRAADTISNMLADTDTEKKSPRRSLDASMASPRIGSSSPREPLRSLLVSKDEELRVLREQLLEKNKTISVLQNLLKKEDEALLSI